MVDEKEVYDFRGIFVSRLEQSAKKLRDKVREVVEVYNNLDERIANLQSEVTGLTGRLDGYEKREAELTNLVGQLRKARIDADISYIEKTLQDSKEAAIILNPNDTIRYVNKSFLELVGQTSEGIVGKDYVVFLRGFKEGFGGIIKKHFENPRRQYELVFVMDNKGNYHKFGLSKSPLFIKNPFRTTREEAHLCTIVKFYPSSWFARTQDYSIELERKLERGRENKKAPLEILQRAHEILSKYLPRLEKTNP